jgi:hypothetical protein
MNGDTIKKGTVTYLLWKYNPELTGNSSNSGGDWHSFAAKHR